MPPTNPNSLPSNPPEPVAPPQQPASGSAFLLPDNHPNQSEPAPTTNPNVEPSPGVEPESDPLFTSNPEDNAPEDVNESLLTWQNQPSAGNNHHPTSWYVVLGLIFAAAIIAAIWTRTWIYLPLGILVPIALTMYAGRGVDQHQYTLLTHAIQVDQKFYSYDGFRAFFVVSDSTNYIIELVPVKRFGTLISLHVPSDQADDVIDILGSVLPETQPEGNLGESVFKRLKL